MIELLKHSDKKTNALLVGSIVLGIFSGLLSLSIIMLINHLTGFSVSSGWRLFGLSFVAAVACYVVTNFFSAKLSAQFCNQLILKLRLKVYEYILLTPYEALESIGEEKLFAINQDDIAKVEQCAMQLPRLVINLFTILFILIYMLVIDPGATLLFILIFSANFFIYGWADKLFKKRHQKARAQIDRVTATTHDLIHGIRELKISHHKRAAFYHQHAQPILSQLHTEQTTAWSFDQLVISWFWLVLYVTLGANVGYLAFHHVHHIMRFVIPLLFVFGPITFLMSVFTTFYAARIALSKIMNLKTDGEQAINQNADPNAHSSFLLNRIQLKQASYSYVKTEEDVAFTVGPFDMLIQPGEIIFVKGGNGSGKSTFIKMLTGLYELSGGGIYCNEKLVVGEEISHYQSLFAVVYQSPHVFKALLGVESTQARKKEIEEYLELLELSQKVSIQGNEIMHFDALSYGQKKRLGLLIALLEDKPIYIFDEWAADQDPHFRKVFYQTILPNLKAAGKTVIAVTHDDEYFTVADRLIAMRDGMLYEEGR